MASFCFVWCRLAVLVLLGLALGEKRDTEASGGGEGGGLGPGCTRLADTSYSYLYQTGQTLTLTCPKQCSNDMLWYHTHDGTLRPTEDRGPQLELPFAMPPSPTMVGFFCCVCGGEHPKMDSCCFGVAYGPEVSSFRITDRQAEVEALHVGQNVVMECTVYGYPGTDTRAEIVGPLGLNDQGTPSHGSYEALYVVNIPHVTVGHSGTYTCQGWLTLTQGGQAGEERSDDVIQKNLIVYEPPTITRRFQEDSATDESVTFVCEVACSIDCNVTWLHNGTVLNITGDGKYQMFNGTAGQHKLTVTLTSPSDAGIYTCVVNTEFKLKETNRSIVLRSASQATDQNEDLPGPVKEEQPNSVGRYCSIIITVVSFILITAAVIAVVKKKIREKYIKRPKNGDVQPLQEDLETGERESGSDTDVDGMSHQMKEKAKSVKEEERKEDELKKLLSTSEVIKGSRRRNVPLTKLVPAKVINS